jgi:predicted Zn-dependent peptidase
VIKKEFPELGEFYWEETLKNGLVVRVIPKPEFSRAYAFLAVDFGSVDTSFTWNGQHYETPAGVAHYLEHKMFDLPEGSAMDAFARYGGSNNAFTNYTMTAYYVECTEYFKENLQILLKMVTTPYFTEESVEKERGIIAQEIRMYEDSADSAVFENLFASLYHTHPARVPIAGTVESISHITAKTLEDVYSAFYRPGNMMLTVMGCVDPESVVREAEENTPPADGWMPPVRNYGPEEPLLVQSRKSDTRMEVSMPTFVLGFKCEPTWRGPETMRQEILGDLAAEMLVGESSGLYQKLYEANLIDSDFSAGFERMKGLGILEAVGDSEEPERVMQEILDETARILREGLDEEQFIRLKKSAVGRRTRDIDSFESTCYRICAAYFDGVEYLDYPAVYQKLTVQDAADFLRQAVQPDRLSLSVIRPKNS